MNKLFRILRGTFPGKDVDPGGKGLSGRRYLIGLSVIFASAYSQYVTREFGPILGMLIIYGVPVWVVSYLFGTNIMKTAFQHTYAALKVGLGLFGLFALLGLVAAALILSLTVMLDPQAENLLNRPNPVLHIPPKFAWVMIGLSMLLVGPAEEYIFRGFVFGGLLNVFGGRHWFALAFFSSALFAAAHLYYALVYGIASLALFSELVSLGLAFAITYHVSGGNLIVPAVLHGVYDATGFLGIAASPQIGMVLRTSLMLIGVLLALGFFAREIFTRRPRQ